MTNITYISHLKKRLEEREIPQNYPKIVYTRSKNHYFDSETNHYVAVYKLKYAGNKRNMATVYDKIGESVEVVTIFPISASELKNKINSGRWKKNEKS